MSSDCDSGTFILNTTDYPPATMTSIEPPQSWPVKLVKWSISTETLVDDLAFSLDGQSNGLNTGYHSPTESEISGHVCGLVIEVRVTRNNHHDCPGCHEKGLFHVTFQEECDTDSLQTSHAEMRNSHDQAQASGQTPSNQQNQAAARACAARNAHAANQNTRDGSVTRSFDYADQSRVFEYGHSPEHVHKGFFISTSGKVEFMDKYYGTIEEITPEPRSSASSSNSSSLASSIIVNMGEPQKAAATVAGQEDFGGMEVCVGDVCVFKNEPGSASKLARVREDDGRE